MEVDEEASEAGHAGSSESGALSSASSSADTSRSPTADPTVVEPPSLSSNIRRSARLQHPPDRLAYPVSSLGAVTAQQGRETKHTAGLSNVRALVEESTDTEASDSSCTPSLSFCTRPVQRKQHKRRRGEARGNSDDSSEEEQVAALVAKLKEGHSRCQQQQEQDVENVSKQAMLQLGRDILDECNENAADNNDAVVYQQRARRIDLLISVSTAMRMVGYYLRAVLAARLKRSHKSKYVRSARLLLGLKSSADISAYPAFYAYVQEHCPSVACAGTNGEMDIEAWLQEPIFLADICWLGWRRYLGKPHRWILDAAMEQFTASLQPAQDWMQRGWVEEYDDVG